MKEVADDLAYARARMQPCINTKDTEEPPAQYHLTDNGIDDSVKNSMAGWKDAQN